jgi:hypothetical protein
MAETKHKPLKQTTDTLCTRLLKTANELDLWAGVDLNDLPGMAELMKDAGQEIIRLKQENHALHQDKHALVQGITAQRNALAQVCTLVTEILYGK